MLQVKSHLPALHVGAAFIGAAHAMPHALQFAGSVCTLTHLPAQFVVPCAHGATHVPPTQFSVVAHALPQAPQFALSVDALSLTAPHAMSPPSHVATTPTRARDTARSSGPVIAMPLSPQAAQAAHARATMKKSV